MAASAIDGFAQHHRYTCSLHFCAPLFALFFFTACKHGCALITPRDGGTARGRRASAAERRGMGRRGANAQIKNNSESVWCEKAIAARGAHHFHPTPGSACTRMHIFAHSPWRKSGIKTGPGERRREKAAAIRPLQPTRAILMFSRAWPPCLACAHR